MTTTAGSTLADTEASAIRAESARWLRFVDARDIPAIAAVYADDGVFLVPNAPLARGPEQVTAVWTQLLGAPNLSLAWTCVSVDVARGGDLAYEVGSYQLGLDGPAGRIEDEGKYVVVWRKVEHAWRVAADIFNSSRPL